MENIKKSPRKVDVMTIAGLGLLTAIIVVLQFLARAIPIGIFSISLCLAPIVVGAALFGKWAGAWLGFVFGVVVLLSGDANLFLPINPVGTVAVVLLKGAAAGFLAGLVYKLIEKKNSLVAVITAGIVSPVTNTGIFLLGCQIFFIDTVRSWGFENIWVYMILGIGLNFLVELAINLVLSSAIVVIVRIGKRYIKK